MAEFIQYQYNLLECIYKLRYDTEAKQILKMHDKMDAKLKAIINNDRKNYRQNP